MSQAPLAAPASPVGTAHPGAARRAALLCTVLLALPLAGGCVYRMAVQQGNYLDARQVDQVQVGMTRAQVRFLLGTPMLPPAFDADRWDYLYSLQMRALKRPERQRLTVYFEGDKVVRIENEGAPTGAPAGVTPATAEPAPAAPPSPGAPPAPDAPPSGRR